MTSHINIQNSVDETDFSRSIRRITELGIRFAMVVVIGWYGLLKFTEYEANAISGFAINSPFLAWLHEILGVQAFSNLIGTAEIMGALLIALHGFSARLGVLGGLMASATFIVTLSFMVTTPGIFEESAGGFPILSVVPGAFLLKDLVLLAVSAWLVAVSLEKVRILS